MNEKIDILNRQQCIEDLKIIIGKLSENRKGCSFAIDGRWGCGKTFILEQLEKDLSLFQNEETVDDTYYIFHYNCWEYDYYEEPAVAIISSMIDKFNNEFEGKVKEEFNKVYGTVEAILKEIAREFAKSKIGIDLVKTCEKTKGYFCKSKEEKYSFDEMFAFRTALDFARKKIKKLVQTKTLLLVVDELDRCFPTYAIKVLERLHHLFDGIDNVIILFSIDSTQLKHSIQKIYGENVDTKNYLKKFIDFSLRIDEGSVQGEFNECYQFYFKQFLPDEYVRKQVTQILRLSEVRIRSLEKMIKKLYLIHQIVFQEQEDASVMLFEIIWGLISCKTVEDNCTEVAYKDNIKQNFTELAEISEDNHTFLPEIIGYELYGYLKQLKKQADEYDRTYSIKAKRNNQGNRNLGLWYVIEKIALGESSFYFEDKIAYQKLFKSCQDFYNMANIIDGDFQ